MAEYIKREDAMDIVKRTSGDYAAAWSEISRLPAADVAGVKHGKWIKSSVIKCSVCGSCTDTQSDEAYKKFIESYYRCPICGAKMNLED